MVVNARASGRRNPIAIYIPALLDVAFQRLSALLNNSISQTRQHYLLRLVPLIAFIVNALICLYWTVQMKESGLQDLGSFLHSVAAYREGLNPYGFYSWLRPAPISPEALNLNPPISVYLFQPLLAVDTSVAHLGFLLGSIAILGASFAWLFSENPDKRNPRVLLVILSLAGIWHTLGYSQIYGPLLLLAVGAWYFMRRDQLLLAGIAIGLIAAIKPNFLLWPMLLLLSGHTRTSLVAMLVTATVSAIPLLAEGPTIYRQWLDLTMTFGGVEWTSNASLVAVGSRLGSPELGVLLGGGIVVGLAWRLWRTRPDIATASALSIAVVLLASPASWAGYTLFLLPALFSLTWDRATWIVVLLLATPFWLVGYSPDSGPVLYVLIGSTYAWATLLLLALLLRNDAEGNVEAEQEPQALAVAS